MNIHLVGRHIDLGEALRGHVEDVLRRFAQKYSLDPVECHVIFSSAPHHFVDVEISLHLGRSVFLRAHAQAEDAHTVFGHAHTKLEKKVRRYKKRLDDHHKHRDTHKALPDFAARDYVLGDGATTDEGHQSEEYPIIAESVTQIPTLSVSEAAMYLDLSDTPIFLFRNARHGALNALYRRKDGNIGWLDPELEKQTHA